jgi:SAM-dependent methyltransferase
MLPNTPPPDRYTAATVVNSTFLSQSYDAYGRIEEQFNAALDQGLAPRGPEMLYDLVADLGLSAGAMALDVGCGEGRHTIELARRFRLRVQGVDPVPRHIEIATGTLAEEALAVPDLEKAVGFELGSAEELPVAAGSVDLVWCRDVLVHIDDLNAAYAEFRRVLKPGGRALVYQMFTTDRLEPREAAWLLPTMGCVPPNMRPDYTEAAIRAAGLQIDQCIVLGTEWGEYGQEQTGKGGTKLLHAARLLREPARYIQQFGQENYDIALGDCLWHVYRLIGKLSDRVYVLSAPHP